MTLSPQQLRSFYPGSFVIVTDETNAVVTEKWVREAFYPWFWQMRTALGLRAYSRKNDCDNFARAAAQAAQDCHALSGGSTAEGIAVGEFTYMRDAGGAHAICTAINEHGERWFFEPQDGRKLYLTEKEISSCALFNGFFVRF